jgi:hypothetical protein
MTMDEKSPLHWTSRPLRVILPTLLASLTLLSVLGGISSAAPVDLPESIAHDQVVAAIISQVATQTLEYELAGLTGERPVIVAGSLYTIATRNSYQTEAISMATRYAYEQFAGLGLVVTYHNYVWSGHQLRNVVAEKPGSVDPDEIYLITAHVDDLPEGSLAPGADDNGSGSVAVLMAARLLVPHRFAHTVRFVLFTGEEQGLRGSDVYAAYCQAHGENIRGVVNLDMIGYNTGEPVFDAYARSGSDPAAPESRQLANIYSDVVGIYDLDLVPRRIDINAYPLAWGSDQWSFLRRGYPAILVIEDYAGGDFTPHYHKTSDRLDTLDLKFFRDLTRAAVATIAHLGRPLPGGHLSGTVRALDTGQPLSATVGAFAPTYRYTFTAPTSAGGVYTLPLPVGGYTLTVWTPSGYYPTTITSVHIVTDTVNVQDVALEPWARLYLPWILDES